MKLSDAVKNSIIEEYKAFKEKMYAGKSLEERKELDQFFTPPEITITMIEKFDCEDLSGKTILDPTCGSGNLLAACLLAGANGDKVFGNDYDSSMVDICRLRLKGISSDPKYNIKGEFNDWQVHRGNALIGDCLTEFNLNYDEAILKELLKRRNGVEGGFMNNPDKYDNWKKQHNKNKVATETEERAVEEQLNKKQEELW